jgi:hypothetical protein
MADAPQALLNDHLAAIRKEAKKKGTPAVIPDRLPVPLVLESDAPCQVKLNSLALPYRLTRQTRMSPAASLPTRSKFDMPGWNRNKHRRSCVREWMVQKTSVGVQERPGCGEATVQMTHQRRGCFGGVHDGAYRSN